MSRSYKKYPLLRDCLWGKSMKKGKQYFNRKIRRKYKNNVELDLPDNNYYRKINSNYELYEFTSSYTKQEIINKWYEQQAELANGVKGWRAKWLSEYSLEEAISDWKKSYKCK